jgi:DNA adenine methylase
MKYMGSKARHAKEILPIILKDRKEKQFFVDVFCGGCNIIDKVSGLRIANDSHYYLIEMFIALQNDWIPPKYISEDKYNDCKKYPALNDPFLVGYVGFNSYGAKFFGGYRRDSIGKRDYWKEHYNNIMKQVPQLKGIKFYNCDYKDLVIPQNSIVYCDPPYFGTTKYNSSINHEEFWKWVRQLSKNGNSCFVSEYSAPDDFDCIWEKKVNNTLVKNTGSKQGVEKLFVYKG